jgi:hypothetical protein
MPGVADLAAQAFERRERVQMLEMMNTPVDYGTPTTPNMIVMLLKEAAGQGKPGLEPREMQMIIARRWWPSVKSEDIGPTAWRMWKEGRLAKDGSLYMLPVDTGITEAAGDLLGVTAASE